MNYRFSWPVHFSLNLLSLLSVAAAALSQNPPLAPTSDVTITVTNPNGIFQYSSIRIPAGVTVRYIAPTTGTPAIIRCDADAFVHGTLSVTHGQTNAPGAGWVTTGRGHGGDECTSSFPASSYYFPPGGGRHAGDYGTAVPFSLEGGSPGGYLARRTDQGVFPCGQSLGTFPGGQGGGTLVLIADGRIEVSGSITADGHHQGSRTAAGSGGSILLRGHSGVSILPGGSVTARGGTAPGEDPETFGAPGYIRLDAWGGPPVVQGTVVPAPTVLDLPYLRVVTPPQIGNVCLLHVYSRLNSYTFVAVSLQPGMGSTPFGELGIALGGTFVVGVVPLFFAAVGTEHDPRASLQWAVPNAAALAGVPLWIQGLTAVSNPPVPYAPRLTNTVPVVIR